MKIGFAGKGGAGKTTLSSFIIKKLAEKYKILALDLDSNVNLATSLGMKDIEKLNYIGEKKEEIMEYTGSTKMVEWEERVYLPKETDGFYKYNHGFVNTHSITDGNIKAMSLGFIADDKRGIESMCDYYEMSKVFMNHFQLADDEILVGDLAAGIEMISRATVMSFDMVFVITDANFKNIKVAKQIIKFLGITGFNKDEFFIIPNKYLDAEDLESITKHFSEYNILPGIPFSEEIYDNEEHTKEIDMVLEHIVQKIIEFKTTRIDNIEHIKKRIELLDKRKEDFLK